MAGDKNIKTTISLEGEKQYKSAIDRAKASVKALESELKLAGEQFKANGDAQEYANEKARILKEQIDQQQKAVEAAQKAIKKLTDQGVDKNSRAMSDWRKKLFDAQTAMTRMQNDLDATEKGLGEQADAFDEAADAAQDYSDKMDEIGQGVNFSATITAIDNVSSRIGSIVTKAYDAAKAIWQLEQGAGSWADYVLTEATKAGMDVETYQAWEYASRFIDTEIDDILGAYDRLNKGMANVSDERLKELNELLVPHLDPNTGAKRDTMEIFWDIVDAMNTIEDESRRDQIAMDLFGKSYRDLKPLFNAGSEAFRGFVEEGRQLAVVPEESVNQLGELDNAMQKLDAVWNKTKIGFLAAMAPSFERIADAMADALTALNEFLQTEEGQAALNSLNEALGGIADQVENIDFKQSLETVSSLIDGVTKGLSWISEHGMGVAVTLGVMGIAWQGLKITKDVLSFLQLIKNISWNKVGPGMSNLNSNISGAANNASGAASASDAAANAQSAAANAQSSAAEAQSAVANAQGAVAQAEAGAASAQAAATESMGYATEAAASALSAEATLAQSQANVALAAEAAAQAALAAGQASASARMAMLSAAGNGLLAAGGGALLGGAANALLSGGLPALLGAGAGGAVAGGLPALLPGSAGAAGAGAGAAAATPGKLAAAFKAFASAPIWADLAGIGTMMTAAMAVDVLSTDARFGELNANMARADELTAPVEDAATAQLQALFDAFTGAIYDFEDRSNNGGDVRGGLRDALYDRLNEALEAVPDSPAWKEIGKKIDLSDGIDALEVDDLVAGMDPYTLYEAMGQLVNDLASAIDDNRAAAEAAAEDLAEGTEEAADNIDSETIGENVSIGLANGINDKADVALDAAGALAANVAALIGRVLEIKSPSKVTERMGAFVGEGFALGIESEADRVSRAVDRMVAATTRPIEEPAYPGGRVAGRPAGAAMNPEGPGGDDGKMVHLTLVVGDKELGDIITPLVDGQIGVLAKRRR